METCYTSISSCVQNNGYLLESFTVNHGARQGCAQNALDFLILAEVVSLKIRQNQDTEGIVIGNQEKRLSQYAVDLWTSTKASQKNLDTLVKLFKEFAYFSGLTINNNETTILRIVEDSGEIVL